ncbi:hypothetical protein GCWU000342_00232 [Shuttleworthella satelles DSM 14600]|uniref:Uncharacterized protein n=1 Tax=Shuttleworthella satelles DSM 14600 TaxID=626523 RepID=C4G8D7_9FIRM|nr:hypothetical protein GCWU000342_00232 [Shuttleworthia satelles DSM 14600]
MLSVFSIETQNDRSVTENQRILSLTCHFPAVRRQLLEIIPPQKTGTERS